MEFSDEMKKTRVNKTEGFADRVELTGQLKVN